ncbi:MAG TPA: hypothetical protein VGK64_22100 [Bryobacteraceae bacterium]
MDQIFDNGNVVTAEVNLRALTYTKDPQRIAFDDGLPTRLGLLTIYQELPRFWFVKTDFRLPSPTAATASDVKH